MAFRLVLVGWLQRHSTCYFGTSFDLFPPNQSMELQTSDRKQSAKAVKEVNEVRASHKWWLGSYAIIALGVLVLYFLIRLKTIPTGSHKMFFQRGSLAVFLVFLLLFISKFAEKVIVNSHRDKVFKYNGLRVVHLISAILVAIVIISFLFQNWYAAALSLGLISLILGFALQGPISSFIGWLYIIFRSPFQVGDRIEISDFKGDVMEVGYLDTTLSEFSGSYLSNDLPSGRLIRFPNSLVLQSAVFNYSWQDYPFIWNEIAFQIAYNSDLDFVKSTIREVTRNELDPEITDNVQELKDLISDTPIDNLPLKEYPLINLRISENTWVEVLVTYIVHPKKAAATRTRIIENSLNRLNQHPDRVLFPKGENR